MQQAIQKVLDNYDRTTDVCIAHIKETETSSRHANGRKIHSRKLNEHLIIIHQTNRLQNKHELLNLKDGGFEICIDGWGLNGKIGAASVFFIRDSKIKKELFRLEDHSTVFQVKSLALLKAIEWCYKHSTTFKVNIFSDLLSVLVSLENSDKKNHRFKIKRQRSRRSQHERDLTYTSRKPTMVQKATKLRMKPLRKWLNFQ
ncbi:hypothetical protein NPIL_603791 [Nephila pilipes]|uniref:RNase H type-1 domain-containing protein n=1 Tax=Nephila pilipes TaxID=299642 RepID=A0A8X6P0L8_NEPPI|nr:hypothetical protein NPIL_603791 [Nephila pilipes]